MYVRAHGIYSFQIGLNFVKNYAAAADTPCWIELHILSAMQKVAGKDLVQSISVLCQIR